jgi:hypothetical protein
MSAGRCVSGLNIHGAPEGIRTPDPRLRRPLLCPPELLAQSGRADLNGRPPAPKAGALPGCATPRNRKALTQALIPLNHRCVLEVSPRDPDDQSFLFRGPKPTGDALLMKRDGRDTIARNDDRRSLGIFSSTFRGARFPNSGSPGNISSKYFEGCEFRFVYRLLAKRLRILSDGGSIHQ